MGASQVHLKNDCQFEELPCMRADCKERVLRRDLRDHVEKACKYREATCSHCKSQVPMITLQVRPPTPPRDSDANGVGEGTKQQFSSEVISE